MTSSSGVGIRALSISHPSVVKTNDYWRRYFPDVIKTQEQQALAAKMQTNANDDAMRQAATQKFFNTPPINVSAQSWTP